MLFVQRKLQQDEDNGHGRRA